MSPVYKPYGEYSPTYGSTHTHWTKITPEQETQLNIIVSDSWYTDFSDVITSSIQPSPAGDDDRKTRYCCVHYVFYFFYRLDENFRTKIQSVNAWNQFCRTKIFRTKGLFLICTASRAKKEDWQNSQNIIWCHLNFKFVLFTISDRTVLYSDIFNDIFRTFKMTQNQDIRKLSSKIFIFQLILLEYGSNNLISCCISSNSNNFLNTVE